MKTIMKRKKLLCSLLTFVIALSAAPALSASAKESVGNGLILSTDSITIVDGAAATFTAVLGEGFDASRLACVVADPSVATITPIAYAANAAEYQVTYGIGGSTVAAVYNLDNPNVVAYVTVNASPLIMDIPSRRSEEHTSELQSQR